MYFNKHELHVPKQELVSVWLMLMQAGKIRR
jgi:hypothetical protein